MTEISTEMIHKKALEKMAETLKALSLPMRLKIVYLLMKGERSVGDLIKTLGKRQALTSQQLSILKIHGVLKSRRNGNVVFYSIKNDSIKKIMAAIIAELHK